MNLPTSVVQAGPAKCNQPCCIKIVKWFYPNFRHFRVSISSNSTVRLCALRALPQLRAASYNAQKGDEKAASSFQRSQAKPAAEPPRRPVCNRGRSAHRRARTSTTLAVVLGSGLIDHSQKMTAAAMQIAEK